MITKKLITLKIGEIREYDLNNKIHSDFNISHIAKSIERNEYISPIIVDEEKVILAWHGRLLAMKKLGKEKVEVLQIIGLSEKQKSDFRISDNKLSEFSEWNIENLKVELEKIWVWDLSELFVELNTEPISLLGEVEDWAFTEHLKNSVDFFTITFSFPKEKKEVIEKYIKNHGKEAIVDFILSKIEAC